MLGAQEMATEADLDYITFWNCDKSWADTS